MFPLVAEAVATVVPVESLRWITFGHVEADECGAMNMWLAAAPGSQVAHGALGCDVSLNDLCDRPPRALADGEVIDLGGKRVRQISTPHVPTGGRRRCCSRRRRARCCAATCSRRSAPESADHRRRRRSGDRRGGDVPHRRSLPHTATIMRGLGDLQPTTLAIMHGSSFTGDGRQALYDLADRYESLRESNAEAADPDLSFGIVLFRAVPTDRNQGSGSSAPGRRSARTPS